MVYLVLTTIAALRHHLILGCLPGAVLLLGYWLTSSCGTYKVVLDCQSDQDCPAETACLLGTPGQCLPRCTATTDCMLSTEQCQAVNPNSSTQVCSPK